MMRLSLTAKLPIRSALVVSLCGFALAWLLTLAFFEDAHARRAPNRYDRRADRETRIPYSRTPAQPNSRRVIVIHSAPIVPTAPSTPEAAEQTSSNQPGGSSAPDSASAE